MLFQRVIRLKRTRQEVRYVSSRAWNIVWKLNEDTEAVLRVWRSKQRGSYFAAPNTDAK